jgi:hypothetical protein
MPSYTSTVLGTVIVVVGGAQVTRMANRKWNDERSDRLKALRITRPEDPMPPVLGGFALGLFLFAAGIAHERLATMLCLLIVITSLMLNGQNLFTLLSTISKDSK